MSFLLSSNERQAYRTLTVLCCQRETGKVR
ncbi:hypothetical protein E2C01_089829 [Portunus trituberculatus]|uniref:Uncharacterized protein n=1 Tax=Portunus trituberculatus TaxID=210409 RepID=A0A5B7J9W1_PORTR|nr:hypothetical protein [Portunus trituberculatus]